MSSEEVVRKWLIETGYPLEMEVAMAFQRGKFDVSQSDYYVDPDTEEPRELDVTAELVIDQLGESDHWGNIVLHVECKRSTGKPWVLFLGTNKPPEGVLFQYVAANRVGKALARRAKKDLLSKRLSLFHLERAAYGMTQSLRGKEGNDECFRALMQVAKATKARIRAADRALQRFAADGPGSTGILIVFSVIVLDGELYVVELDKATSALNLRKVTHQVLLWRNPAGGAPTTVVHVVSRPALNDFVTRAAKTSNAWFEWCENNLQAVDAVSKRELGRLQRLAAKSWRFWGVLSGTSPGKAA